MAYNHNALIWYSWISVETAIEVKYFLETFLFWTEYSLLRLKVSPRFTLQVLALPLYNISF